MKSMADRQNNYAQQNRPRIFHPSDTIHNVRFLIWLYLWLLVFEGVFRKWVLPQFSAPLLLIRDPVVLLIYLAALRARIFPSNIYVISLAIIAVLGIRDSCAPVILSDSDHYPRDWVRTSFQFPASAAHLHHSGGL
jgi:hypothetical protein